MANWKGTAVPNTGYVEKVYLNTNLSIDEVNAILSQLTYVQMDEQSFAYFFLTDSNMTTALGIETDVNKSKFIITAITSSGEIICYDSANVTGVGEGWLSFDNPIVINSEVVSEAEEIPVGTQNDKLTSLFSTTPFVQVTTTEEKLRLLLQTKTNLKNSINNKGGTITDDTPFDEYPTQVDNISSGANTSDATATENDILLGKTAYTANGKVEGTIATYNGEIEGGVISGSSADIEKALTSDY